MSALAASLRDELAKLLEPLVAARSANLGEELAEQLVTVHLRRHHPRLFSIACLLTLIDPVELHGPEPATANGGGRPRAAWLRDELHLERLDPLVNHTWATLS